MMRKTRRMRSALLVLVMALALLPVFAFAAPAAMAVDGSTVLDTIALNVPVPSVGDVQVYRAGETMNVAHAAPAQSGSHYTVTDAYWNPSSGMAPEVYTFTAGAHFVEVVVQADEGYTFAEPEDMTVTVNGETAEVMKEDEDTVRFVYWDRILVEPPVITAQPADQNVYAGDKAVFSVTATGDALKYQWQVNKTGTWNNCTSTGYNKATFSFTTKASYSGWQYRCLVSNGGGSVTSDPAVLTVTALVPAEITAQPQNVYVANGEKATFALTAAGTAPVYYQWQVSKDGGSTWKNCTSSGYSTASMSFTAKTSYSGWMYRCMVSNAGAIVYSNVVTLTVEALEQPLIGQQPTDVSVKEGTMAFFTVTAAGGGLNYQWQVSKDGGSTWKNCTSSGCTSEAFGFTTKASYSGWMYRCVVSNVKGSVTSDAALLTVTGAAVKPSITGQPSDQNPADGKSVSFTVTASGSDLGYQWQVSKDGGKTWKNCSASGYNTKTLKFTAKASYNGWMYHCIVTNSVGSVTSRAALLTVNASAAKPVITGQPSDQNPKAGEKARFTVTASGSGLSYRWQVSKDGGKTWKDCTSSGYNTASMSFTAKASYSGWMYRCTVSNENGSVTSDSAVLTVS